MAEQAELKRRLHYDQESGHFTWLIDSGGRREIKKGTRAGSVCKTHGYRLIGVDGSILRAGRLAWFYVTGEWPDGDIDHIDTVKDHDWFSNLRDVPHHVNNQNLRKAHKDNQSGYLGVCAIGNKWRATIFVDGRQKSLGCFPDPAVAHAAYLDAKRLLHEGCTL